jgi:hypothetical protein
VRWRAYDPAEISVLQRTDGFDAIAATNAGSITEEHAAGP